MTKKQSEICLCFGVLGAMSFANGLLGVWQGFVFALMSLFIIVLTLYVDQREKITAKAGQGEDADLSSHPNGG